MILAPARCRNTHIPTINTVFCWGYCALCGGTVSTSMKYFSLLALSLAVAAPLASGFAAQGAPTKWQDLAPRARRKLPAEVGARLPPGAVTLHLARHPIGPGGAPMLVHIWSARRASAQGSYWPMEQSPVCVAVFAQGKQSFMRTASAVFLSDEIATEISTRWLYVARKHGPVLVLVGPSYTSTKYTLVVFPGGVAEENSDTGRVQHLYQGGVGGGKIVQDFGVDAEGMMTVETESSYAGKVQSKTVGRWNGYGFKSQEPESAG